MNKLAFTLLCLASSILRGQSQPPPLFQPQWFAVPQLSLRCPPSDETPISGAEAEPHEAFLLRAQSVDADPTAGSEPDLAARLDTVAQLREFDLQVYYRLEKEGYFMPPERSGNLVERAFDAVFAPEEIRFGKVSVSCSIVTAIKRKNPLCLINPLVLQVSW